MWPTPDANERGARINQNNHQFTLQDAVKNWPFPRAGNPGSRPNKKGGKVLAEEVKNYPTPKHRDYRSPRAKNHKGERYEQDLNVAIYRKENEPPKGQLNPSWVCWLMGWPIDWASLEPCDGIWLNWSVDPADNGSIPRVETNIPNRIQRLKAIGNGQVPIVVKTAWELLSD